MLKMVMFFFICCVISIPTSIYAQQPDHSGIWEYAVRDTPYGDYFGNIYLNKKDETYEGKIVNDKGEEYSLNVIRTRGNQLIFQSDIEDSESLFMCTFSGDSLTATIEVSGDDFLYRLNAIRKKE